MTRSDRFFRAHKSAAAWAIQIAAPVAAAATAIFYLVRARRRRRWDVAPIPPKPGLEIDDDIPDEPDFWEEFDAPAGGGEEVRHSPRPLTQLESDLGQAKSD